MTGITGLDFNGKKIRFEKRGDRVWVSLTDMAKATGKLVAGYMRNKDTKEFLAEMEVTMRIRIVTSNLGGQYTPADERGTWAIEEVAIDFAAWCNVKFRVWVSQQIKTLMTEGTVSIAPIEHKSRITDLPCPWKKLYEKTFCDRVFGWFGADFYWKYAYCDLTAEEEAKINRLNPPVKGVRGYKIHQYLEPETRSRLAPYLNVLTAMVDTARTRKEFEGGYARHFGGNDQLRIPGVDK